MVTNKKLAKIAPKKLAEGKKAPKNLKRDALRRVQELSEISNSRGLVTQSDFMRQVSGILAAAKWNVIDQRRDTPRGFGGDLLAGRTDLGTERRYAIDCLLDVDSSKIQERFSAFRNHVRQSKQPFADFDEYWIVGYHFPNPAIRKNPGNDRHFRVLDLPELRDLLEPLKQPKTKQSKATTKIGKAVETNEKEINLAIAGLTLQVDAKLEALSGELPNSDDGRSWVAREISDFERMKAELERVREMVAAFTKGKVPEQEVVKATKTFRKGVEEWWTDKSGEILTSTAKGAVLVSSISLLALMKADSVAAITAVAAVVNGGAIQKAKQIGSAIKRIGKRAFATEDDGAVQ
jgi:hypothetical protein